MSEGQVTVRIPGISPPIAELVIDCFPLDAYTMIFEGLASVEGFSAYGTAAIIGPLTDRYLITLSCYLSVDEAQQLAAIVKWSSDQYKAKLDGHLEIDFELEHLIAEPAPHSRTLINSISPSWSASYEYGYGRLNTVISLPPDFKKIIGRAVSDGTPYELFQFSAVEV